MLLNQRELAAIRDGRQPLVFRRWQRPTVKAGGTLKTAMGLLAIEAVDALDSAQVSDSEAQQAGHESSARLLASLASRSGTIYRIRLRYAGDDPRIALREQDELDDAELAELAAKLARLDKASQQGNWTRKVLQAIAEHPHLAAAELAERTGFEKEWLKLQVRKLKNLGLTISHHPGYELSPRGRVVLSRLTKKVNA
jgi:hypothetical protein